MISNKILVLIINALMVMSPLLAGEATDRNHRKPKSVPLLLQFNIAADLVVVGKVEQVTRPPTTTGGYEVVMITIDRVIAAVSNQVDVGLIQTNATSKPIIVLQKLPLSHRAAEFISGGQYLCWLEAFQPSEEEVRAMGLSSSRTYTPVTRINMYGNSAPGVVLLSPYKEVLRDKEYQMMQKTLGKDPEWYQERNMKDAFGVTNATELVEATSRSAGLMIKGKDTEQELDLLSRSENKTYSKMATVLRELGMNARRFDFVDAVKPTRVTPARNATHSAAGGREKRE